VYYKFLFLFLFSLNSFSEELQGDWQLDVPSGLYNHNEPSKKQIEDYIMNKIREEIINDPEEIIRVQEELGIEILQREEDLIDDQILIDQFGDLLREELESQGVNIYDGELIPAYEVEGKRLINIEEYRFFESMYQNDLENLDQIQKTEKRKFTCFPDFKTADKFAKKYRLKFFCFYEKRGVDTYRCNQYYECTKIYSGVELIFEIKVDDTYARIKQALIELEEQSSDMDEFILKQYNRMIKDLIQDIINKK